MFSTHPMPGTAALSHGFVPINKKTFSWFFFQQMKCLLSLSRAYCSGGLSWYCRRGKQTFFNTVSFICCCCPIKTFNRSTVNVRAMTKMFLKSRRPFSFLIPPLLFSPSFSLITFLSCCVSKGRVI